MFFLFGLSTKSSVLPSRMATCRYCGSFSAHHVEERATRFTLFFIPVLTTSKAYHMACSHCGQHSRVNGGELNALPRLSPLTVTLDPLSGPGEMPKRGESLAVPR
jgi:hypothetical protein